MPTVQTVQTTFFFTSGYYDPRVFKGCCIFGVCGLTDRGGYGLKVGFGNTMPESGLASKPSHIAHVLICESVCVSLVLKSVSTPALSITLLYTYNLSLPLSFFRVQSIISYCFICMCFCHSPLLLLYYCSVKSFHSLPLYFPSTHQQAKYAKSSQSHCSCTTSVGRPQQQL